MKLSLIRNLQMGFGLSLLLFMAISVASYTSIENLLQSAKWVDHSNMVLLKLENVISTMKDAETGQRGFLLTHSDEFLEPYNGSYQKALNIANEVQQLTKDNPQQQQNVEVIKNTLLKRLNVLQALIDKKRSGKIITLDDVQKGKLAMDALRRAVDKAEIEEKGLLKTRLSTLKQFTWLTPLFVILATLLAVVIAVSSYLKVTGDVVEKARLHQVLEKKERETANSNEKLAAANEQLIVINRKLAKAQGNIQDLNEELVTANEELISSNEELIAAHEELYQSHQDQASLNKELEERVLSRTKALAESESRFRIMMETIPQIAWTNTPGGEVVFYNRQWYAYTGLDEEQTKAQGWSNVMHPDDIPVILEKSGAIIGSGKGGEFEIREKRADGAYRWHLVRMEPVKDNAGNVQLWAGTATDIHDLKQLQQQKDDFISIASHELKGPITGIVLSLELLNKLIGSPSAVMLPKLVEQANKSADKLKKMVENLLDFSKLTMGQIQLNKSQFAIGKLIDDYCDNIRAGGVYTIVITGDWDLQVYADIWRIEQVVANFLNNAIKYAPESKKIKIHIEKEDDMAKVSVTDKGVGIPAEKIPRLFERYYQAENSRSQLEGLGLGLYIVSEIIKKHDGQFGATSKLGKGSTFWFTLPLNQS